MIDRVTHVAQLPNYERTVTVRVQGHFTKIVAVTEGTGTTSQRGGDWQYETQLEISIDLAAIVRTLGAKAIKQKGRKSSDGHVTVKWIGKDQGLS